MKTVLITGSTGFLGKHFKKYISTLGWEIFECNSKTGNLFTYENLSIYDNINFDYIFHLAAKTKAGDYCIYHKGEQWIDNQLLNTNILKYWALQQPQAKMIAMGSSCMYEPTDSSLKEADCTKGDTEPGLYAYAHTKRMLLIGLQSIAEQYGLKYLYLVPSTLYGPDFVLNDNHFIFDLIKKIYNGKYNNEDVTLWGDGYQRRELIYVKDAIYMMVQLLHIDNEIINIGTGQDYSIREYANNICNILDYDPDNIIYDISKYTGAKVKILDTEKLLSYLSHEFQFTPLKTGIRDTIDYYINACK